MTGTGKKYGFARQILTNRQDREYAQPRHRLTVFLIDGALDASIGDYLVFQHHFVILVFEDMTVPDVFSGE